MAAWKSNRCNFQKQIVILWFMVPFVACPIQSFVCSIFRLPCRWLTHRLAAEVFWLRHFKVSGLDISAKIIFLHSLLRSHLGQTWMDSRGQTHKNSCHKPIASFCVVFPRWLRIERGRTPRWRHRECFGSKVVDDSTSSVAWQRRLHRTHGRVTCSWILKMIAGPPRHAGHDCHWGHCTFLAISSRRYEVSQDQILDIFLNFHGFPWVHIISRRILGPLFSRRGRKPISFLPIFRFKPVRRSDSTSRIRSSHYDERLLGLKNGKCV